MSKILISGIGRSGTTFLINMKYIEEKYSELCKTPSDINEHLPILYNHAKKCESVFEVLSASEEGINFMLLKQFVDKK